MQLLSGDVVSKSLREKIKSETESFRLKGFRAPGIACVLVGADPASKIYVDYKEKAALSLGFYSKIICLEEKTTQNELLKLINDLNNSKDIDAILIQSPLPKHIDESKIINALLPSKDVDIFHPVSVGNMWIGGDFLAPCTPAGVIEILKYYNINMNGSNVVIIGRSNIVGKPMAALFLKENATVTICHSKTKNLPEVCKLAEILVSAIGKPKFITKDFIKNGAVVVDVGINRIEGSKKITGDVDFEEVSKIAGAVTPVPGGVGPMTITMLMQNTLHLYKQHINKSI